jgi:hypothetical protein
VKEKHMRDPAAQPQLTPAEQIENWFSYHPPDGGQQQKYVVIRDTAKHFAEVIVSACPPSADRTTALRTLRETVMWANASIACGGK